MVSHSITPSSKRLITLTLILGIVLYLWRGSNSTHQIKQSETKLLQTVPLGGAPINTKPELRTSDEDSEDDFAPQRKQQFVFPQLKPIEKHDPPPQDLPPLLITHPQRAPPHTFALAVKTGQSVAASRLPIQLMTFLSPHTPLIVADYSGRLGGHAVHQVYTPPANQSDAAKYTDITKTAGWKNDAHKNLPTLKLLSEQRAADWYILIDDDTYISLPNLMTHLTTFDPSQPHYIGSPTTFVGCDGVHRGGPAGPLFAHGGSGIVISRAALALMLGIYDTCIEKYATCWAGDIRTSLCLRDAGVKLTPARYFNNGEPGFWWPADPCERWITFHHLEPEHVEQLWDLESRGGRTYGDLWAVMGKAGVSRDTKRFGMDYRVVALKGGSETHYVEQAVSVCKGLCMADFRCRSWVYESEKCWLKSGAPRSVRTVGAYSGIVMNDYKCKK